MDELELVRDYAKATGREVILRIGPLGQLSGYDRMANSSFGSISAWEINAISVEELIQTLCDQERGTLAEMREHQDETLSKREAMVEKLPL